MAAESHSGGCLCGAVRFAASGAPVRALACHCTWCQRTTSSAFSALAFYRKRDVRTSGHPPVRFDTKGAHGRGMALEFCGRCGTRVGLLVDAAPTLRMIPVGTFDDPDFIDVKIHQFVRHAVWRAFPGSAEVYLDGRADPATGKVNAPLPHPDAAFVLDHPSSPGPMNTREKWEGGCLCGAVRYTARCAPRGKVAACHCRFCARYCGTAMNLLGFYLPSDISVTGTTAEYTAVIPPHGRTVTMSHCPTCGVRLFARAERMASQNIVLIYLGTLDGGAPEPDLHQFVGYCPKWMAFPPGKPCFPESQVQEDMSPAQALPDRGPWARGDWRM
ncbi:Mss4-like protein [Hyaloraphidium curvatum]|nr:Mss4-like protein [Hyaloraphidium curvatum]